MKHFLPIKHMLLTPALLSGLWLGTNAQLPQASLPGRMNKSVQVPPAPELTDFCAGTLFSRQMREALGTEEAYRAQYEQNLQQVQEGLVDQRAVKVLPTVVHVIYNGASENISDARINDFINAINLAFNQQNNQTGVRAQFQSVIGNPQVQFCLAKTDPNGQPTTGIVRKSTTLASFPQDSPTGDAPIKKLPNGSPTWNPQKYVNIWIVDIGWLANSGGVAGYAYLPNTFSLTGPMGYLDGLVVDVNATFTQSPQGDYSIGIHELGHYLGLPHPFDEDGSCATDADGFTDTPKTNSATFSQPNCNTTVTKCSNTVQTENFMDYTLNCHKMFTLQQASYINTILNPTNGFRRQLLWNGCNVVAAPPVADFSGCNANVPQNSTVTFTDASTGVPTSWSWSITPATGWAFVGGTSASSQNPQVQFTTQGTYTVALTATNAQGTNTKTSASCITVVAPAACNNLTTPLVMGFEATEDLTGWTIENTNGDLNTGGTDHTWGLTTSADLSNAVQATIPAHGGDQMAIYLYSSSQAANDWLYTPCLALQPSTTYTLSFWHHTAGTAYPEKLRVKIGNTNASTAMTQTIVDLGTLTNATWVQSTTTFTVPAAGNYNIGFQCYSNADQFFLLLDDINISRPASPAPTANFTGCGNFNTGTTVTLTNTSTGSPTSYSWSITPATGWSYTGGTSATSANPQIIFTTAGTYTVALTATNANGSNTKTSNGCLVIAAPAVTPVANFTGCGNYSTGSAVTFTNTSTGSPTSYSWSITPASGWSYTGGTNASSVNPQVIFSTAGTYNVALTATNAAGSNTKTSNSCVVASNGVLTPVAGFTGCGSFSVGSTVQLTNTSANSPTSYSWSITPATGWNFAGGTNATSPNPQITFTTPGSYTIALTATNSAGSNTSTSTNCVAVSAGTVAPIANFSGCGNFATGSTVTFNNTSSNSPTSYTWNVTPATGWNFAGGTNASSANPQITFTANGTFTVALTATNSAGSDTKNSAGCVVITSTGAAPQADFLGCPGTVTANSTITFANTSTNNPTSNQWTIDPATGWSFMNGTNASSSSIQVQFNTVGSYTVTLTATNNVGSNTKTVMNCVQVTGMGIDEAGFAAGLNLFPNPTTGITTLSIGNVADYTDLRVTVYNSVGVRLFQTSGNLPSEVNLDMTEYSAGIYFIEIRSNEAVATKRLVLNK